MPIQPVDPPRARQACSNHGIVQQRFDRAPFLATRALPVVAARAKTATAATVTRVPHQQLVGDVLEVVAGSPWNRRPRQASIDQGCFAANRRTILQLLGEVTARCGDALLRLDQPGNASTGAMPR